MASWSKVKIPKKSILVNNPDRFLNFALILLRHNILAYKDKVNPLKFTRSQISALRAQYILLAHEITSGL